MNDEQLREQLEGLFSGLADSAQELGKEPQEPERAPPEAQEGEEDLLVGLLAAGHGQDEQVPRGALPQPVAAAVPSPVTTPREAEPRRRVNRLLIIWVALGTLGMVVIVLMAYRQDNFFATTGKPTAEQPAATAEQPGFVLLPTSTPTPSPAPTAASKSTRILGPPPSETPPPDDVLITSTPTPLNTATAANSLRVTGETERADTATPLPLNWVTPVLVTATPTAEKQAAAVAPTTGEPPDVATATPTPTPTPTYVLITSRPKRSAWARPRPCHPTGSRQWWSPVPLPQRTPQQLSI
jgi:hypothetical protein